MNESEAIAVLGEVKAKLGRNFKSPIRDAWMNGNYYDHGLEKWSSQLQNIRNSLGPSFLVKVKVP